MGRWWLGRATTAALVAILVGGCSGDTAIDQRFREAERAADDGDWSVAVAGYLDVLDDDGGHGGARVGLEAGTVELIGGVGPLPVGDERRLLDWLESEKRWDLLRGVMDVSIVSIPSGWGVMGAEDGDEAQRPVRRVYVDGFTIDRYEVTNLQYAAFRAAMP